MPRRGGARHRGSGMLGPGARARAALLLCGVLMAGGAPAFAADATAPDPGGDAQDTSPVPLPAVLPAPATRSGFSPDGGFGGAATFIPVAIDPSVVPDPPVNEGLPAEVDAKGPFAQQVSCDPVDRPGVTAFALLLSQHYGRPAYSGARPCIDYASFHHDGRALDWALDAWDPVDRQIADSTITWLTDNDGEMAHRFGLEYLIWNGLIWSADSRTWSFYTANPHTDHIHFSFTWDGAQMRTSWWTGVAVTQPDLGPCDVTPWQYAAVHQTVRLAPCEPVVAEAPATGLGRVRPGESGNGVSMLQQELGLPVNGVLDDVTRRALMEWQQENGLPATGVADDFTYAVAQGWELSPLPAGALSIAPADWQRTEFTPHRRDVLTEGDQGEAVKVLQEALGVETDGSFGPLTAAALAEFEETVPLLAAQAARRGDDPAVVTPLTWVLLERVAHPTIVVREVALHRGSLDRTADPDGALVAAALTETDLENPYAGGAVTLLQELLGVEADGSFGPITEAAVMEVQKGADLEPTGLVDGPTWAAVEAHALEALDPEVQDPAASAEDAEDADPEQTAAEERARATAARLAEASALIGSN